MSKNRVQLNSVVSSQLPAYVQEDYPLVSSFLKQYYIGQEYQSGPVDLIQNIDEYIKLDNSSNIVESVILQDDINFYDKTIKVDPSLSPSGTIGFPDTYGLLKIDNEIITYRGKTDYSFTGCRRGFVGISSYKSGTNNSELVFEESQSDDHNSGCLKVYRGGSGGVSVESENRGLSMQYGSHSQYSDVHILFIDSPNSN